MGVRIDGMAGLKFCLGRNGSETDEIDHANVAVRPPALFGLPFLAALVLEIVLPLGPGLAAGPRRAVLVGVGLIVLGAVPFGFAVRRFLSAGTNVPTWEPSLALVEDGPYRYTRNPIYIGLVTIYFGLSVALTSVWALIFLPPLIAVLHNGVVLREEAYLTGKFGDAYRAFQRRVPRWL